METIIVVILKIDPDVKTKLLSFIVCNACKLWIFNFLFFGFRKGRLAEFIFMQIFQLLLENISDENSAKRNFITIFLNQQQKKASHFFKNLDRQELCFAGTSTFFLICKIPHVL